MANRKQPIKAAFSKHASKKQRNVPHLKPLSVYSRKVFCKANNSCGLSWSPDCPSWNLNVELSNIRASVERKRRLDDSCLDATNDTPPKKPCLAPSDSGCVLDSFDTFEQENPVSLQSSSVVCDEIKSVEKSLYDQKSLDLCWVDGSHNIDGASHGDVHSSSPVTVHNEDSADVIGFDYDVDEIMCLSPIDRAHISTGGLEDFNQSGLAYYEEGHSSWYSSRPKQEKSECSPGKETRTRSDEGYVKKSDLTADPGEAKVTTESEITKSDEVHFIKPHKITATKLSRIKTQPVSIPIMSTPLSTFVKRPPILTRRLDLDKENWCSPTILSKPVKASSAISPSACVNLDIGNEREALSPIPSLNVSNRKEDKMVHKGKSIHKSMACHNQEKKTANQVKEDVLSGSNHKVDDEIRVTFSEETDATDNFTSPLPRQVHLKSDVVLCNTKGVRAYPQPEKKAASESRRIVFIDIPRPVVLYREEDWEKEKKVYVESVKRHMTDNMENGVMSELLHLMDAVANRERGIDGRKWQHPSDLTRRNFRLCTSSRLLSLDEWQNLNYCNHRRFAKVPQVFERSPVT